MSNIAIIVFDSLRKDSFEDHFDWLPGLYYDNAWSTSGWTVPAHGSLFTGLYPSEADVYAKHEALTTEQPVLAEALSAAGYETRGFSANANISDAFNFTRGFDEFHHSWRGKRKDENVLDWGAFISRTRSKGASRYLYALKQCLASDVDTWKSLKLGIQMKARDIGINSIGGTDDGAKKALRTVRNMDFTENEFLFMNLMEAHAPYNAPNEYGSLDIKAQASFEDTMHDGPDASAVDLESAYDNCVQYLSDIYQDIYEELIDDFDYIITLSDHGEMFGRDGLWDHNHGVYPELVEIPLCISDGTEREEQIDTNVSLVDIYRTVLDITDCEGADSRGRNIIQDLSDAEYLVERHGLRSSRIDALQNKDYSSDTIAEWDESYYGIVHQEGDYAWQSKVGMQTDDGVDLDAASELIDKFKSGLSDPKTKSVADSSVPSDVQDRLRELGYAT
jgi:arylsulfatase A-like enzyme